MNTDTTKSFAIFCLTAALVVTGCNRSESVPEKPATPPSPQTSTPSALPPGHPSVDMSQMSLPASAAATAPNPAWTVPEGWQAGQPSSIRRGSWMVRNDQGQTADISVTAFPGDVGGSLANINRWRGQIGMQPITAEEESALTTKLDINGEPATLVEFATEPSPAAKTRPQRMIVVTIPHQGDSWFIKMSGDDELVAAQKPALLQFANSIKF